MSNMLNKKKPLKLKLDITNDNIGSPQISGSDINNSILATTNSSIHSATSDSLGNGSNLDSKVLVNIGDKQNVLISPSNLNFIQQLGRGQYGIVEKVFHKDSGQYFAVKRVALPSGNDNEGAKLLMDVDILVKGTKCKNIIKFYGALLWEGDLWILMELMDCSLDRFYRLAHKKVDTPTLPIVKQDFKVLSPCTHLDDSTTIGNCELCNPIPEKVLGRMAADIVNALSYLYSIQVIHRDIKPSNILINQLGVIKLCDFGISGYLVNSVARTYEAGCRPYMAPERIDPPRDRTGYDIKSDVWSLGITIIEIATGRYPYSYARDFFEQLKSICTQDPPQLPKGLFSQTFEDFISQCLRKDYKSRPKYDGLDIHPFIESNRCLEIKEFVETVLAGTDGSTKAVHI